MIASDSIVQHVTRIQKMARQLTDVGEIVSDVVVMAKILASLPSKYNAFQTASDSIDPNRLAADDDATSAFAARSLGANLKSTSSVKNSEKSKIDKKEIKCYYYKKKDHFARECLKKKQNQKSEKIGNESRDCAFVATSSPSLDQKSEKENQSVLPSIKEIKRLLNRDVRDVWFTCTLREMTKKGVVKLIDVNDFFCKICQIENNRKQVWMSHEGAMLGQRWEILSERDNRTIVESAEVVNTTVNVLNRTTSSKNSNATPYEISYLHINKQFRKFDSKAKKVLLVGYQGDSANYRLYNPKTRNVSVSRVMFNETTQKELSTEETSMDKITFPQEEEFEKIAANEPVAEEVPDVSVQEEAGAGRSMIRFLRYACIAECNVPITHQEAINGPNRKEWIKTIEDELEAHKVNKTWNIVPKTENKKLIDSKWIFKVL
ncbi:hypothetical protein ACFW04_012822 [Cataglyphis niger]